jgi:hypothetical protein
MGNEIHRPIKRTEQSTTLHSHKKNNSSFPTQTINKIIQDLGMTENKFRTATASNVELKQEYNVAKERINITCNSIRTQDSENIFKFYTRQLQENEVTVFYNDLSSLAKGFLIEEHFNETIDLFKKMTKFQTYYDKSLINRNIEQKSLDIIQENLDVLHDKLQKSESPTNYKILDLIAQLTNSDKNEVVHTGVATILNNQEIVSSILRNPKNRRNLQNVIKSGLAFGDFDQQIATRNIVIDAMVKGTDKSCAGFMGDLLNTESYSAKSYAEQIIADVLNKKYKLDAWAFIQIWRHIGQTRTQLSNIVRNNISTIDEIEQSHPGYSKILYDEFGIVNPGGYSATRLIRQVENKDIIYDENNIVAYPYSDYNGAFRENMVVLDDFASDLDNIANEQGKSAELRIYEYGDLKKLDEILHGDNKYGEVKRAVVGGHGRPTSIDVGWENLTTSNLLSSIRPFANRPTLILVSCSTGQGSDNIAKEFSKLGAKVMAPDIDAALSMIRAERKDEELNIVVGFYGGAIVKVFENGQEILQAA